MYGSVEGWQEYVAERGIAGQTIADPESLPVLVRASDYIKYHYVVNFMSQFDETVPEVVLATYEAACIENLQPGFFTKKFSTGHKKVLVAVESVRWEKVTGVNSDLIDNDQMVPVSTKVEMYLSRYMRRRRTSGIFSVGSQPCR